VAASAGASVAAGAAVVAGAPQAERSIDVKTNRLAKDHNKDFLFISLLLYWLEYGFDLRTRVLFLESGLSQTS
jgi:hypothetical protein